jgi:hypothetical protein
VRGAGGGAELEEARRVFDGVLARDIVSWNTMVTPCSLLGMCDEELLQRVPGATSQHGTQPQQAAEILKAGNYAEVTRLVSRMKTSHGPGLDFVTVVIGLKACGRDGCLRIGRELHGVAVRLGFDKLDCVENSLITIYSTGGMICRAYLLFKTSSTQRISR